MAVTTKELGEITEIAKMEALGRRKAELYRSMIRDERVEDLLNEVRRLSEDHLEQMHDLVREP